MSTKIFALAILAIMLLGGFAFAQFGYNCYGYYGYMYSCNEDSDDKDQPDLDATLVSTCDGNVVTVTREGGDSKVSGAHVVVKDMATGGIVASGDTEPDGTFTFPVDTAAFRACGMEVVVKASKSGYRLLDYDRAHPFTLVPCDQCGGGPEPGCTLDSDCPSEQRCSANGACEPVQCGQCQAATNHVCDNLCSANQVCQNNICQQPPGNDGDCTPPGCCTSDNACEAGNYCALTAAAARGSCQPIPDCSKVENGVATQYECGDEPGCPTCPPQTDVCMEHSCYPVEVECQTDVAPGDDVICTVTANGGKPVPGFDVVVTNPDGSETTYTSGPDGTFVIPGAEAGTYSINLGTNPLTFTLGGEAPAPPTAPPSSNGGFNWGLVILLLLLLGLAGLVAWLLSQKKLKF